MHYCKAVLNFSAPLALTLYLCGFGLAYQVTNNLHKKLALEVLRTITNQSTAVSTFAVKLPLCKLASVAEGDAKKELLSVLGFNKESMIQNCYMNIKYMMEPLKKADLLLVNKIYLNYTDDIKQDFISNSSEVYGVQIDKVGFNLPKSAVSFINRWVETTTYRRLRDLLTLEDINENTTMILVSAAHLKGTWEFPFDVRHTTNKKFHFINKKISMIPMMKRSDEYLYYEDDVNDFKMMKVNFGSPGTAITFVVPNSAQGLPEFLTKLYKNPDLLKHCIKLMSWKRLTVSFPRFKIKTYVDWTEYLKKIGVKKIFDVNSSGLEGILKKNGTTKNISLDKAKQKVFLEIDEMGISRHEMKEDPETLNRIRVGPGIGLLEFTADRPFYFIITIEQDNEVHELFNGVYYGPE